MALVGRTVTRVVDGDTLVLDGSERVRLIGVDTPRKRIAGLPQRQYCPSHNRDFNEPRARL